MTAKAEWGIMSFKNKISQTLGKKKCQQCWGNLGGRRAQKISAQWLHAIAGVKNMYVNVSVKYCTTMNKYLCLSYNESSLIYNPQSCVCHCGGFVCSANCININNVQAAVSL